MAEKIVGLRGQVVPTETGADPEIIAWLERALEEAKRGEIVAILASMVRPNDVVQTRTINNRGRRHQLVASLVYLSYDLGGPDEHACGA